MDSDIDIILNALHKAIIIDPYQFNRAKTESLYGNFRKEVNAFLERLIQEKRTIAEKECRDLEYSVKKMKRWFDNNYSNSNDKQKYENVQTELLNIRNQIKNKDYALYVKAIINMVDIRKKIDQIQISINNDLESAERELKLKHIDNITPLIRNAYNNRNRLIWKKRTDLYIKIILFWGFAIFLIIYSSSYTKGAESGAVSGFLGIFLILGISAVKTFEIEDKNKNFISKFLGQIIPSLIFFLIAGIIFVIVGSLLEIILGETIADTLFILGLIFCPFFLKNKNIILDITKIDTEISNLKYKENERKEYIIKLPEKIQIAKESL